MAKEFEHILNECIDRMLRGDSVEQCLGRYPEQAAELEPLLRVAQSAQKVSSVEPRPEFKAQARQQLRSVLYRAEPNAQPRRISLLGFAKSRVVLASVIAIALVVGLSLLVPALLRQPTVVLAEETAMEDPGVQILLAEKGFQPSQMYRTVTKSDTENIYLVKFMTSEDGELIATVTVNVKERVVTLVENDEQFTRLPTLALAVSKDITQIAERDSRVQDILETGAEIGGISYLSSPLRKVVGLDLLSDGKRWVVMIDPVKREVVRIFQR
ncbi:MAG: hypothetical protein ACWGQW_24595 [bacterium]